MDSPTSLNSSTIVSKPNKAAPVPTASTGSRRLILVALVLGAAFGTWALLEFVIWNHIPGALVGKWVVEGGPQDGATFDFLRNGTMTGRINLQGREGIVRAGVRVEGNILYSTTTNPHTGASETRQQTIEELSRETLILKDGQGARLRLVRAD
ncbi:MAG: hypothetical protein U0744_18590 [Gemmataceae bacterium]